MERLDESYAILKDSKRFNNNFLSLILVFFEHDKEATIYEIVCQEDGSFKQPDEWPRCVASKLVIKDEFFQFCIFSITISNLKFC